MSENDLYQWLFQAEGLRFLRMGDHDTMRKCSEYAKLSGQQKAALAEQVKLRRKAASKFDLADYMVFTPKGLQQATDFRIGQHKAIRFGGYQTIADACCGIGGDLIAISKAADGAQVLGYDLSSVAVAAANINCLANRVSAMVKAGDVCQLDMRHFDVWHIDPDRRPSSRRTTQLESFQPPESELLKLLSQNPNAAIKLAPATNVERDWLAEAELEWIGHSRSCQQVVAWTGSLARRPGQRVATILTDDGTHSFLGVVSIPISIETSTLRYVYEPHATILSSGLASALAQEYGMSGLIPGGGYLTSDLLVASPFLTCFEVLDVMPFREKKIRRRLRERFAGTVEVKKRGVDVDPLALQRRWSRSEGEERFTVLITRRGQSVFAIIAKRLQSG